MGWPGNQCVLRHSGRRVRSGWGGEDQVRWVYGCRAYGLLLIRVLAVVIASLALGTHRYQHSTEACTGSWPCVSVGVSAGVVVRFGMKPKLTA